MHVGACETGDSGAQSEPNVGVCGYETERVISLCV